MPTETLPTRSEPRTEEGLSRGFIVALALHGVVAAGLIAAAWISHRIDHHWGDQNPVAGSIQASMVNALPLPPKQRFKENEVLTSDKPSIAHTPPPPTPEKAKTEAKPKTEPPPKPNEVLIPDKVKPTLKPNVKPDARVQPDPAKRAPSTPAPPTPKATTGDTAGVQIPQSITQLKNGTASITVEERAFGDRYAYYIRLIAQKINQSKSEGDPDGPETRGKRTIIQFTIDRDGVPADATVATRSGSAALDLSTLRAIQRIDTFGPLPAGSRLTIHFEYDSK